PAAAAVRLVGDVMLLEERVLRVAVDAIAHVADAVRLGPGEPVAQRDVTIGRDAEQSEAGPARIGLADALVQLLERLLHVREAVMPVRDGGLEELFGQLAELI